MPCYTNVQWVQWLLLPMYTERTHYDLKIQLMITSDQSHAIIVIF